MTHGDLRKRIKLLSRFSGFSQVFKRFFGIAEFVIQTSNKNTLVVIDVYATKENMGIVGWRKIDAKGLEKIKKTNRTRGRPNPHTFSRTGVRVGSRPFCSSVRIVFREQS